MSSTIQEQYKHIAEQLNPLKDQYDLLLYVGRFCPMHVGHQAMIGGIVNSFTTNHLIFVGSCNEPMSMRNLFNYADRSDFIAHVFPNARVAGIPDFKDDDHSWFRNLDDLITVAGATPERTVFIGGCREDVEWYYRMSRQVHIVNRFGGTTTNVSGTEIRDCLIGNNTEKLQQLIDPSLVEVVQETFTRRWDEFRKR